MGLEGRKDFPNFHRVFHSESENAEILPLDFMNPVRKRERHAVEDLTAPAKALDGECFALAVSQDGGTGTAAGLAVACAAAVVAALAGRSAMRIPMQDR